MNLKDDEDDDDEQEMKRWGEVVGVDNGENRNQKMMKMNE